MTEPQWYALTVGPSSERRVKEELKERGFGCYVPMEINWHNVRGRRVKADRPLFRGYVFVQADDLARLVYVAKHLIQHVTGVFEFKGRRVGNETPQQRAAKFMDELHAAEDAGVFDMTIRRDRRGNRLGKLKEGDSIVVTSGALAGRMGRLLRLDSRKRAKVLLHMLDGAGRIEGSVEMTTDLGTLEHAEAA